MSPYLFQLHSKCIYMPINITEDFINNIQFYKLCYVMLIFIIHILDENLPVYMKMSPPRFYLYSKCIFMPIILSKFCPNKSSILSITLIILYFIIHMLDFHLKCSVLSENVSTSFFSCIQRVFLCPSLYLSLFHAISLILYITF